MRMMVRFMMRMMMEISSLLNAFTLSCSGSLK